MGWQARASARIRTLSMKPLAGSRRWFEITPRALEHQDLAVLMIRVGLAINALNAQRDTGRLAASSESRLAFKNRNVIASLVTSAGVTFEAIRVASAGMSVLRPLAQRVQPPPEVLKRIGKLCAGKHPASEFLNRARNQLGFHWDSTAIVPVLAGYRDAGTLIWVEGEVHGHDEVHRLAVDVLAHALFPDGPENQSEAENRRQVTEALKEIHDAMAVLAEFFTAATYGYLLKVGASPKGELPSARKEAFRG